MSFTEVHSRPHKKFQNSVSILQKRHQLWLLPEPQGTKEVIY